MGPSGEGRSAVRLARTVSTCKRNNLGITIVVFRNEVWGAELLNQLIWTDARAVGTEIENPSIAGIARAYGVDGVTVLHPLGVEPVMIKYYFIRKN